MGSQVCMTIRTAAALLVGKAAQIGSRVTRLGGGSALPGMLAELIDPQAVARVVTKSGCRTIVVTGSNGKTTTCKIISQILRGRGMRVVSNTTGANLPSGVASAIVGAASLSGRIAADALVVEVDEASMSAVISAFMPDVVTVTNCFRDQLDRYGEVDAALERIRRATDRLPSGSILILNADDPLVVDLARTASCRVLYYGMEDHPRRRPDRAQNAPGGGVGADDVGSCLVCGDVGASDVVNCLTCGRYYVYTYTTFGHLGHYKCPGCGAARPSPDFVGRNLQMAEDGAWSFTLEVSHADACQPAGVGARVGVAPRRVQPPPGVSVSLSIPGLYNAYNALAAAASTMALGTEAAVAAAGIGTTRSAFGRMEQMKVGQALVRLALVKNPVGLSQVFRSIASDHSVAAIMIGLNDNYADGRDVSWIWDVDVQTLLERLPSIRIAVCSGTRAWDMALRLKYAGLETNRIHVAPDVGCGLETALAAVGAGETLVVLPTYTAMLDIRRRLKRQAHLQEYWQT